MNYLVHGHPPLVIGQEEPEMRGNLVSPFFYTELVERGDKEKVQLLYPNSDFLSGGLS